MSDLSCHVMSDGSSHIDWFSFFFLFFTAVKNRKKKLAHLLQTPPSWWGPALGPQLSRSQGLNACMYLMTATGNQPPAATCMPQQNKICTVMLKKKPVKWIQMIYTKTDIIKINKTAWVGESHGHKKKKKSLSITLHHEKLLYSSSNFFF